MVLRNKALSATRVAGYCLAVIAMIWTVLSFSAYLIYQDRLDATRAQLAQMSVALANQVQHSLQSVDLALQGLVQNLQGQDFTHEVDRHAARRLLREHGSSLPSYFSILLVDRNGVGVASSESSFVTGGQFSDREYFRYHTDSPNGGLYIGRPLVGRTIGKRFFPISRRLTDADGAFAGVLMGSIDARYIADSFQRFPLGSEGTIALLHTSGRVVSRVPDFEANFDRDVAASPLFTTYLPASPEGEYEAKGPIDGRERVMRYRQLPNFPLVLSAGFSRQDVLTGMASVIRIHIAFGALASFAAVLGALMLLRAHRRSLAAVRAEEQLDLARQIIDNSSEAILVTDADNRIISVNPAFEAITGYSRQEVVGQNPRILRSGHQSPEFYREMWQRILSDGRWDGELWDRRKSGEVYPKWLRINTLRDPVSGQVSNFVGMFSDISEQKRVEAHIYHAAHHDPLTDLPNRALLEHQLVQSLALAEREKTGVAVMFIDLDRFKSVNDSLGHHVGDDLLLGVAKRITNVLRVSDLCARWGGDEFVVVLHGVRNTMAPAKVAQNILDSLEPVFEVAGHALHTGCSIGISMYPGDGEDAATLMRNADTAMYHAKSGGRNAFRFYAPDMNSAAARRIAMEHDLREAIERGQLVLYYQPLLDLHSGRISAAEALIRWRDPVRGLIPPGDFIPLAEETGLIVPIGDWVFAEACRSAVRWAAEGLPFGRIAINVSVQQLRQDNFVARVRALLLETEVDPAWIEMEITESALMETGEASIQQLLELRALGISLAIDDFGTGYSSLAYLQRFPVSKLKIDRSFVFGIGHGDKGHVIPGAVIALAHSLDLQVVAEGVEQESQADYLRTQGCDFGQGFLFSRPLPEADFVALLARRAGDASDPLRTASGCS